MNVLAVPVSDQVPVPYLLIPLLAPPAATTGPATTPLPAPPMNSGRLLEATELLIVPVSVSRPASDCTMMPLPPVEPTFSVPDSVVAPWRFWIVGEPPIVGGLADAKFANGLAKVFVPATLSCR